MLCEFSLAKLYVKPVQFDGFFHWLNISMLDVSAKPCFIPSDLALLKNVLTALFVQYLFLVSIRNGIKALLFRGFSAESLLHLCFYSLQEKCL